MKESLRVLVIDDDAAIRRLFEQMVAARFGVDVRAAPGGAEGLELLTSSAFDLILVDLKMPAMDGLAFIERARRLADGVPMVIMTAYGSIENAVEAVKSGASDYLVKPFKLEQVERILTEARRSRAAPPAPEAPYRIPAWVGRSALLDPVHAWVGRMRASEANALIVGESGTGKELIARALHFDGRRREGPFTAVDCAAIPQTLMESELFGHVRGAFTGAHADRAGLFGRADGGTIFLDEIGELPPDVQGVLLRALEERRIRPVGSSEHRPVDVRIVAATNRDLEREAAEGRFRRDLFYRLNVVMIRVPPLRERKEDLPELVRHFLARQGRGSVVLSPAAREALERYDWPGNVRELKHALERSLVLARGERIDAGDLPEVVRAAAGERPEGSTATLRELEGRALRELLSRHRGNTAAVARALGIDRSSVYRKARRHGIDIASLRRR
jgi:DNA-binding NtrC family response regulator